MTVHAAGSLGRQIWAGGIVENATLGGAEWVGEVGLWISGSGYITEAQW